MPNAQLVRGLLDRLNPACISIHHTLTGRARAYYIVSPDTCMTDVQVSRPLGLQPAFVHEPAAEEEALSSPQLEDASSQGSSLSQPSQPARLGQLTGEVSAPNHTTTAADVTPPSSNASVPGDDQPRPSHPTKAPSRSPPAQTQDGPSLRRDSNSPKSASSQERLAGAKRTATGEVKVPQSTEHTRPSTSERVELGHAGAASALSTGSSSNVSEVWISPFGRSPSLMPLDIISATY